MPNNYTAPYLISTDRPANVPATGTFTIPVCTTSERFDKIMSALFSFGAMQGDTFDLDHLVDFLDAMPRIVEGCVDFTSQCRKVALNSPQIEWFPESPYAPLPEIPEGYEFHPWTIASAGTLPDIIIAWGLGYQYGDVFTDLSKFPDITDPANFLDEYQNLPRFRVTGLVGSGTIKAEILSIPLGGRLVVIVDEFVDLLNLQAADTDADLSFPPESIVATTITTTVTGDGEHTVDYVFYPTFETELPLLGGGGGVRSIEICGFGVTTMPEEACCDETNQLLGTNNEMLQKIYLLLKEGATIKFGAINELPDMINIDGCAPEKYDQEGSDDEPTAALRVAVLCYVTYCYVMTILVKALSQMGMPLPALYVLFPLYANSPTALQKVKVEYPEVLSVVALITGIPAGGALIDLVVCQMVARLTGQFNTFEIFRNSLDVFGGVGSIAIPVSGLVNASNQLEENWRAFGEALAQGMEMEDEVTAYTCPCEIDCTTPLELQIKDGRGVSITKVEGSDTLYHFIGTATGFDGVNYFGGMYVKDAFNRCMAVWNPDEGDTGLPVGWSNEATLYHHVKGCCGTPDSTGLLGGFAGTTAAPAYFTEFYWDRQTEPLDHYLHVECYECP